MSRVIEEVHYDVQTRHAGAGGDKWETLRVLNEEGINGFRTKEIGLKYLNMQREVYGLDARLVKYHTKTTIEVLEE